MTALDDSYWDGRYAAGDTPWDLGAPAPPLAAFIDQLTDRNLRILIPGAGRSYEAEYLWKQGFANTHVIDLSEKALAAIGQRVPDFPAEQLLLGDFFAHEAEYDLILEQTFFCAIYPSLRLQYAYHCASLLRPGGKLIGLLWDDPMQDDRPPYGGSKAEYEAYFESFFETEVMDTAHNSIAPRAGRELFVKLVRKS